MRLWPGIEARQRLKFQWRIDKDLAWNADVHVGNAWQKSRRERRRSQQLMKGLLK